MHTHPTLSFQCCLRSTPCCLLASENPRTRSHSTPAIQPPHSFLLCLFRTLRSKSRSLPSLPPLLHLSHFFVSFFPFFLLLFSFRSPFILRLDCSSTSTFISGNQFSTRKYFRVQAQRTRCNRRNNLESKVYDKKKRGRSDVKQDFTSAKIN
jgi:hypothetical protein